MSHFKLSRLLLIVIVFALAGCSSTTLNGSWKNPEFDEQISKIYVVGVSNSNSEINRRMLETKFAQEIAKYGIVVVQSYKDIADAKNADNELIAAKMKQNGADSMLITRVVGTRTEQVMTPGRISSYQSWSRGGFDYPYSPAPHYRHWGSYYNRCCSEVIYEPPTFRQYEIATVEANLYLASSGELIWAGQLETTIEFDLQKMVDDFVQTVVRDLREKGII